MTRPMDAAQVIAQIENQAAPVRGWSYVLTYNGRRYMASEVWATRREVIGFLEDEWKRPWREIKAAGYDAVKVTTYEGWAN